MIFIFFGIIAFLMMIFPKLRCFILNTWREVYYIPKDLYFYIVHKEYNRCPTGVLVAINGLFGKGKTLTAVHMVAMLYKKKEGLKVWCPRRKKLVTQRIHIISNVELLIPYEKFIDLQQVVYAAENNREYDDLHDTLTITLVLGDEYSVQMNSRNFKTNIDPLFLNTILTCRHNYISLYYTSQRFAHVDALLRQVTSYAIECNKTWRLQGIDYYDAWQLENAASPKMVQPFRRSCWFVNDYAYKLYDTLACVENLKNSMKDGDMLTEEEILKLQSGNMDIGQVLTPSRKYKHVQKRMYK